MFFVSIFVIILALFVIGWIWAFIVSRKVKTEGIDTEALVSRVELHEWSGEIGDASTFTEEYYITYTNQEGQSVEAMLTNFGDHTFKEGDRIQIRYLPERQDYPVLVKVL